MNKNTTSTLELNKICKHYYQGSQKLEVLQDLNLTIYKNEIVALIGPSGSGKSTLLQIAGLLDRPDRKSVV